MHRIWEVALPSRFWLLWPLRVGQQRQQRLRDGAAGAVLLVLEVPLQTLRIGGVGRHVVAVVPSFVHLTIVTDYILNVSAATLAANSRTYTDSYTTMCLCTLGETMYSTTATAEKK